MAQTERLSSRAPFGAFIDAPKAPGDRARYDAWLAPVTGLSLRFHLNHVQPTHGSVRLNRVERHRHAAQDFLPMDAERFVVTVMPSRRDGAPELEAARNFVLRGTRGVVYAPGV